MKREQPASEKKSIIMCCRYYISMTGWSDQNRDHRLLSSEVSPKHKTSEEVIDLWLSVTIVSLKYAVVKSILFNPCLSGCTNVGCPKYVKFKVVAGPPIAVSQHCL
jgi:hypothetical protein